MQPEDYIVRNSIELDFDDLLEDPEIKAAFDDAEVRSDITDRLRQARKNGKISQREVAETMGTTQSAVSDFERGETDPQLSTIQRYARAVGASVRVVVDMPGDVASIVSPYRHVTSSTSSREPVRKSNLRLVSPYSDIKVS